MSKIAAYCGTYKSSLTPSPSGSAASNIVLNISSRSCWSIGSSSRSSESVPFTKQHVSPVGQLATVSRRASGGGIVMLVPGMALQTSIGMVNVGVLCGGRGECVPLVGMARIAAARMSETGPLKVFHDIERQVATAGLV